MQVFCAIVNLLQNVRLCHSVHQLIAKSSSDRSGQMVANAFALKSGMWTLRSPAAWPRS